MVTDIELASVKLVEKFCRRIEGQYVELAMQPYAPRAFRFIELLRVRHNPKKLSPAKPAGSSVCVWDLHLQSFERAAWIKHVLREPDAPDFDRYLAERLHEDA